MIYQDNTFEFHVPVEIQKSKDGDSGKMLLAGIASTADKDREGENLIPEGFDYKFLLDSGYINWHHQAAKNPEAIIGEPTNAKLIKGKGLYIEAELYRDSEMAQKAYGLAQVLTKNSQRRKLGWSIEGKVLERDPHNPNRVTKARITGVALTHMPINPKTFVSIMKAMSEDKELENTEDFKTIEAVQSSGNGGDTKILTMGNKSVTVQKGFGEDEDDLLITVKSLNTSSGAPIMPESVEGNTKPNNDSYPAKKKEKTVAKGMDEEGAYEYMFATHPNLSVSEAKQVMEKINANKN